MSGSDLTRVIEPRLLRRLVLIPVGLLEALITVPVAALIGAYEQAVGVWDEVVDLWREPCWVSVRYRPGTLVTLLTGSIGNTADDGRPMGGGHAVEGDRACGRADSVHWGLDTRGFRDERAVRAVRD